MRNLHPASQVHPFIPPTTCTFQRPDRLDLQLTAGIHGRRQRHLHGREDADDAMLWLGRRQEHARSMGSPWPAKLRGPRGSRGGRERYPQAAAAATAGRRRLRLSAQKETSLDTSVDPVQGRYVSGYPIMHCTWWTCDMCIMCRAAGGGWSRAETPCLRGDGTDVRLPGLMYQLRHRRATIATRIAGVRGLCRRVRRSCRSLPPLSTPSSHPSLRRRCASVYVLFPTSHRDASKNKTERSAGGPWPCKRSGHDDNSTNGSGASGFRSARARSGWTGSR